MDDEFMLQKKMTNLVSETFSCIRTVIAFGAQRQTINKCANMPETFFCETLILLSFFRYERYAHQHNRLTEERLRASSVYDALAQILFTELIFTAALCYGMWKFGDENVGRLGAVREEQFFLTNKQKTQMCKYFLLRLQLIRYMRA